MAQDNYNTIIDPYNEFLKKVESSDESDMVTNGNYEGGFIDSGESGSGGGSEVNSPSEIGEGAVSSKSFNNIWLSNWIKSRNYQPKKVGFFIDGKTGYAEFTGVYVSGTIESSVIVGGELHIPDIDTTANSFHVGTDGNVWMGATQTNKAIAPVQISNDGKIKLGNIGSGDYIILDGVLQNIRSSNYVTGANGSGFSLSPDLLEVGNIATRGIIRTAVFEYNSVTVNAGSNITVSGADVLSTDMTALDVSTLEIEGNDIFSVGDILYIKDKDNTEWLEVTDDSSAPIYVVERDKAGDYAPDGNPAWSKGASVSNYGQSGDGGVYLTASDTNAPYLSVFRHTGTPWVSTSEKVRLGKLDGIIDPVFGALSGYGLWTDSVYLTGSINATSGLVGGWEIGSNYIRDNSNSIGLSSDITSGDDVRFWAGDTFANREIAPFRVYESGNVVMERITASNIQGYDAIVDITGGGDYYDLAGAINSDAKNIYVRDGEYILTEELIISGDKIRIEGESKDKTIITRSRLGVYSWFTIGGEKTRYNISNPSGNTFRYTATGKGGLPNFSEIKEGYRVFLDRTGTGDLISGNNAGTFSVTGVSIDDNYFEVENSSGVVESDKFVGEPIRFYYRFLAGEASGVLTEYAITHTGDTMRFTYTGNGGDPNISGRVYVGSLIDAIDASGLTGTNKGSFIVTDVGVDWFEVKNVFSGSDETVNVNGIYVFPREIGDTTTEFNIELIDSDKFIFRYTYSGTGTNPNTNQLRVGDDIYINSTEFNSLNNGRIIVIGSSDTYFDVYNELGVEETGVKIGAAGFIIKINERLGSSDTAFDITNPSGRTWRYTWDGTGTNPRINTLMNTYDNINISASEFSSENRASRTYISDVGVDYFEIKDMDGVIESGKRLALGEINLIGGFPILVQGEDCKISNIQFLESGNRQYGALYSISYDVLVDDCYFNYQQDGDQRMPCLTARGGILSLENCKLESNMTGIKTLPFGSTLNVSNSQIDTVRGAAVEMLDEMRTMGDSTTEFDITNPTGDTWRYTYTGTGTDPGITSGLSFWDIAIYAENIDERNCGAFEITGAGTDYFEVSNENGHAETGKTIGGGFMLFVFLPLSKCTLRDNKIYRTVYTSTGSSFFNNVPVIRLLGSNCIVSGNTFSSGALGNYTSFIWSFGINNIISDNNFDGGSSTTTAGIGIQVSGNGGILIGDNIFRYMTYGILYSSYLSESNRGNVSIHNNYFEQSGTGQGIYFYYGNSNGKITINDNVFSEGLIAIYANSDQKNLTISGNIATGTSDNAFNIVAQYSTVIGNIAKDCNRGFYMNTSEYCTIIGNISENNTNADSFTSVVNCQTANNIFI